jgi:hypothetical protein
MAQILVPGVAQAKLQGTIAGHPWVCIWHYQLGGSGGAWSNGQLSALAVAVYSGWGSFMKSFMNVDTVFDSCTAVDIGQASPAIGSTTGVAIPGTDASGGVNAPQLTANVKFLIGARYRGGHPRTALPALGATYQNATADAYTSGTLGSFDTAFANLQDGIFAAVPGIFQVVPRYHYTRVPNASGTKILVTRTSLNGTPPQVVNWLLQAEIGTQRRRNTVSG